MQTILPGLVKSLPWVIVDSSTIADLALGEDRAAATSLLSSLALPSLSNSSIVSGAAIRSSLEALWTSITPSAVFTPSVSVPSAFFMHRRVTLVGISCGPLYFLAIASCLAAAVAVDAVAAAAIPAVTAPAVFRKLRLEVMRIPLSMIVILA